MQRALEISEANAFPYISKSSGISKKQKTGIERSRYPNKAVTLIEQSPQQNYFQSLPHLLKISGYTIDEIPTIDSSAETNGIVSH